MSPEALAEFEAYLIRVRDVMTDAITDDEHDGNDPNQERLVRDACSVILANIDTVRENC